MSLDASLYQAIEDNDDPAVRCLIRYGAQPCERNLIYAISHSTAETVTALLQESQHTFEQKHVQHAMYGSVIIHRVEIFEAILVGATVKDPNFDINDFCLKSRFAAYDIQFKPVIGSTLLHLATCLDDNCYDAVKTALLSRKFGANVNARNAKGQTPLHLINTDNARWTQQLIARGADPNVYDKKYGETPLHKACARGFLAVAKELSGADTNALNNSYLAPLNLACMNNHLNVARWLITTGGANPRPCNPPFIGAIQQPNGSIQPIHLLELGLDPFQKDDRGNNVLHAALQIDNDKDSTETLTARTNFIDDLLCAVPRMISTCDCHGNSVLHLAACFQPDQVPRLVEKHGADLTARNDSGRTPLMMAIPRSNTRAIRVILTIMKERNVDIDSADVNGWTSLHWAAFLGKKSITRLLLEFGADCNAINHAGRSPIHYTGYIFIKGDVRSAHHYTDYDINCILNASGFAERRRLSIPRKHKTPAVEVLLDHGADATLRDRDGNLPFFLATATFSITETLIIMRAAASQGLFEQIQSVSEKPPIPTRKRKVPS